MLTQTQHIIKNTSIGYKDITKSCIIDNPDQFILVIDDCVVCFIQNHQKAAQNGCSKHHKGVWDANPLKVKVQGPINHTTQKKLEKIDCYLS